MKEPKLNYVVVHQILKSYRTGINCVFVQDYFQLWINLNLVL